jgi:hypothetical protein
MRSTPRSRSIQSQPLNRIRWSTPVDLKPQYTSNELLIHYGSPLLTPQNTVIVPVKTGATSGFEVEALSAANGAVLWTLASDYVLPPHDWVPEFGPALTPSSRVYLPGAGGTVYYRDSPDSATGPQGQIAFYGLANYQANEQSYTANVMISTPIVSDSAGDIYFGFEVIGATPLQLQSGIARISASGQGSWIAASAAAGDPTITEVVQNCTPALSQDQGTIYIAVSNGSYGYLLALNSTTLQKVASVALKDPVSGQSATLSDDGTASPTIGVDGDVYYGVLENPEGENHYRGWLLHFDSLLANSKTPGAFGWDDTASMVPSFMVPSYAGTSPYLLMTKYNDYADAGGTGQNRIAILDPNATETYTLTGTKVMNEVADDPGRDTEYRLTGSEGVVHRFRGGRPGNRLGAGRQRGWQALPVGPGDQQLLAIDSPHQWIRGSLHAYADWTGWHRLCHQQRNSLRGRSVVRGCACLWFPLVPALDPANAGV